MKPLISLDREGVAVGFEAQVRKPAGTDYYSGLVLAWDRDDLVHALTG